MTLSLAVVAGHDPNLLPAATGADGMVGATL